MAVCPSGGRGLLFYVWNLKAEKLDAYNDGLYELKGQGVWVASVTQPRDRPADKHISV
jgi:hypothetical protein